MTKLKNARIKKFKGMNNFVLKFDWEGSGHLIG